MTKFQGFHRVIILLLFLSANLLMALPGAASIKGNQFPEGAQDSNLSVVTTDAPRPQDNGAALVEEFSFHIKDFKVQLQGELNTLNITVRFRYVPRIAAKAYPDFRSIAKEVEGFLINYPQKMDYWEIINKRLTLTVLNKYPVITSLTIEIQVSPTASDPYLRSSIVRRNRLRPRAPHKGT
jgi:hypothetical protein